MTQTQWAEHRAALKAWRDGLTRQSTLIKFRAPKGTSLLIDSPSPDEVLASLQSGKPNAFRGEISPEDPDTPKPLPPGTFFHYAEKVAELLDRFPLGRAIVGEQAQKDFIALFGAILRLQNILASFDDFEGNEILTERQMQDYRSIYLDLYAEFRKDQAAERERINDDVVFEIELIKQVEINVDYILLLVQKYRGDGRDKEIRAEITRAIDSSPSQRNKKELIEAFVDRISATWAVDEEWNAFVIAQRAAELDRIIDEENLRPEQTQEFIDQAFRDGSIQATGTAITKVLPPASRFAGNGGHGEKKQRVLAKLGEYFERFFGLNANGG